jgi:hypothetical protein
MPRRTLFRTTSAKVLGVAAAGCVVLGVSAATALAVVPGAGGPPNVPGGFVTPVASATVSASGGTVTGEVNGDHVTVTVPAGAVAEPVDVMLTAGSPSEIGNVGVNGASAVLALGVHVTSQATGNTFTAAFAKPATVTVSGSFNASDTVMQYNVSATRWELLSGAVVTTSQVHFNVPGVVDVAITGAAAPQNAKAVAATPVDASGAAATGTPAATAPAATAAPTAGTTTVDTGEPFLLEEIVAGFLVLLGLVSLLLLTRYRRANWSQLG